MRIRWFGRAVGAWILASSAVALGNPTVAQLNAQLSFEENRNALTADERVLILEAEKALVDAASDADAAELATTVGQFHRWQGHYAKALPLLEKAVSIWTELGSAEEHLPAKVNTYLALGLALDQQELITKEESAQEQAFEAYEAASKLCEGAKGVELQLLDAEVDVQRAEFMLNQTSLRKAKQLASRALTGLGRLRSRVKTMANHDLARVDSALAEGYHVMASIHLAMGRSSMAKHIAKKALTARNQADPDGISIGAARDLCLWGRILSRDGHGGEAKKKIVKARAILAKIFPEGDSFWSVRAGTDLAWVVSRLGDKEKACQLLEELVPKAQQLEGDKPTLSKEIQEHIEVLKAT